MIGLTSWTYISLSLLLIPALIASLDFAGGMRARHTAPHALSGAQEHDFTVLVPIYGSIRFLENAEFLADYAGRVILCTTDAESAEFNAEIERVSARYGFAVFYGAVGAAAAGPSTRRQTGGTVRDRLIRDAVATVTTKYTVCIDADTITERPLYELVGEMDHNGYDLVSVPLEPANLDSWLGRVQAHEYRLAMLLRRIGPWLVSGACHAGRTTVLAHVMRRHSLFFQGNDVETGLVAEALGYHVGHIPFAVPTTVPSTLRAWFRQRLAWAGGEFRLFIVNFKLIRRHPVLWFYGIVVMFSGVYFRWYTVITVPLVLLVLCLVYLVLLTYINWHNRDRYLLLMPIYAAMTSLVMVPLALPSYLHMALKYRNAGVILSRRPRA